MKTIPTSGESEVTVVTLFVIVALLAILWACIVTLTVELVYDAIHPHSVLDRPSNDPLISPSMVTTDTVIYDGEAESLPLP